MTTKTDIFGTIDDNAPTPRCKCCNFEPTWRQDGLTPVLDWSYLRCADCGFGVRMVQETKRGSGTDYVDSRGRKWRHTDKRGMRMVAGAAR